MTEAFHITPETRLKALLDAYPHLEEKLIQVAPVFEKLRNPVLRNTIARIATLRQVAQTGNIPLATLIDTLRAAIGEKGQDIPCDGMSVEDGSQSPSWFDKTKIVKSLDARPILAASGHPLATVMNEVKTLQGGEIFELITPFYPAPLVDKVKAMGYASWSMREAAELIRTYFTRSSG